MKKLVALLLAAMMLLAMAACGNEPQPTPTPDPTPEVDNTVVDPCPQRRKDRCGHHLAVQPVLGQHEDLL